MNEADNTADILERAADLIESVGHSQGDYREWDRSGKVIGYCAVGAIRTAAGVYNDEHQLLTLEQAHFIPAADKAVMTLAQRLVSDEDITYVTTFDTSWDRVTNWNDDANRKATDVIEKMKQVAKDLRNTAA